MKRNGKKKSFTRKRKEKSKVIRFIRDGYICINGVESRIKKKDYIMHINNRWCFVGSGLRTLIRIDGFDYPMIHISKEDLPNLSKYIIQLSICDTRYFYDWRNNR